MSTDPRFAAEEQLLTAWEQQCRVRLAHLRTTGETPPPDYTGWEGWYSIPALLHEITMARRAFQHGARVGLSW